MSTNSPNSDLSQTDFQGTFGPTYASSTVFTEKWLYLYTDAWFWLYLITIYFLLLKCIRNKYFWCIIFQMNRIGENWPLCSIWLDTLVLYMKIKIEVFCDEYGLRITVVSFLITSKSSGELFWKWYDVKLHFNFSCIWDIQWYRIDSNWWYDHNTLWTWVYYSYIYIMLKIKRWYTQQGREKDK